MKLKKEYIILFLIILALVLYLLSRKQDKIEYELPILNTIQTSEVSKIEILFKGNTLAINRTGDKWTLGSKGYRADKNRVKNILDFLERVIPVTMASDSKNYTRYGLDDDSKIEVSAFSNDSRIRKLDIGYSVSGHDYTFVRLENDHRVYHVKGKARNLFETDLDGLRDKTVLSFDRNSIKSIIMQKDDKTYEITVSSVEPLPSEERNEPEEPENPWRDNQGNEVNEDIPESILSTLTNLKCEKFLYDSQKTGSKKEVLKITLTGEKDYTLTIFEKADEDDEYSALSLESPDPFILSEWKAEKLINSIDKMEKTD